MNVRRMRPLPRAAWVGVTLLAFGLAGSASADTGVVTWPTFFRTGPGSRFVVLEELARGAAVEVGSCADHWCQVRIGRVVGYVNQANLGQQAPPSRFPPAGPQQAGCFDSRRSGYKGGEVFLYCPR